MSFFDELRRRKVVRTTIAYLVAAFAAAQVTQLLVDGLGLPHSVLTIVLIVEIALLPLVIGLAWAFDITSEGVEHTTSTRVAIQWKRVALPAFVSGLLLFTALGFYLLNKSDAVLNNAVVAVMPFSVSGDPQIAYLENGMVDLLAAKLTGEGGPRAADPRAVLSAAKKVGTAAEIDDAKAREIARSIGAGQVLTGSIVGTPARFTIHTQLTRATGSKISAEESTTSDSLLVAIDRIVAKLLSIQAGEGQRLAELTTTSLPGLRMYLDGQAAYRSGHFGKAAELFARAVDTDTTFALAALMYQLTGGWGEGPPVDEAKIARTLRTQRARLGAVDRAMAEAMQDNLDKPYRARFAIRENIAERAPDRADAWFIYGDLVDHYGATADIDFITISNRAFNKILQIDSSYLPALLHLMDNAYLANRLDEYRRLEAIRKVRDPGGTAALYQRSFRAHVLEDSADLRANRATMDTAGFDQLFSMSVMGEVSPVAARDANAAIEVMLKRAVTPTERAEAYSIASMLLSSYGRPGRVAALFDQMAQIDVSPTAVRTAQVLTALYEHGDSAAAARSATLLPALIAREPRTENRLRGQCALEHWRLWNGDTASMRSTTLALAQVPKDSARQKTEADVCIQTLMVIKAMAERSPSLTARVQALDALMREGPLMNGPMRNASNIVLSRAAEATGDRALAYRAMKRTPVHPLGWVFRSTMQRESARLAALNGDRAYAILQYRRYLNSHELAEPAFKRIDDAARADLARLTGER